MKAQLRMMITDSGHARHFAFRLPGVYGWYSLCGLAMDEHRTLSVERFHDGRLRRPDCRSCAKLLRAGAVRRTSSPHGRSSWQARRIGFALTA